ncbi:hypothetical protein [Candidatus Halocynthiibacter alkanivorans]|uniref:hypothetical protein n=1 Tax=Candidatus Halocynthiibacter alkanivorans TaxID=2267619 RepID=UPI00109C328B|nr:hypothetical protein [Candidatus Halocynthiibacter alkanivorans]
MPVAGSYLPKGRSLDAINRYFGTLRYVCGYGVALGNPQALQVKTILGEIKFPRSAPRSVVIPRGDVRKIVDAADAAGAADFALGILLQFEFGLRPVDIRGNWLAIGQNDAAMGGIVRNGTRWQDGLTWDMVAEDYTGFSKVISKTAKSIPEPQHFDLSHNAEIRSRLRLPGNCGRVGPVIRSRHYIHPSASPDEYLKLSMEPSLPYTDSGWRQAWNRYRDAAWLSKEFRVSDLRASAITEAKNLGATTETLRDIAVHMSSKTTERYMRDRSDNANKVVKLRSAK